MKRKVKKKRAPGEESTRIHEQREIYLYVSGIASQFIICQDAA